MSISVLSQARRGMWSHRAGAIQVNFIITPSLGSIETDHVICVISESCYNEFSYDRQTNCKIIILGAMTWLCYIENCTIARHVIMRLNCTLLYFMSTF